MAKTEALVNNTYKQKNRVMLNGDGNENGIKFNRSNWHKNEFARAAHFFFSIAKKQICTCSTLFCLSLPLFCTTTIMPSCTLLLWRNCRVCLLKILLTVFMFASAAHFHLAGRSLQAANLTVQGWNKFYIELVVLYVHRKIAIIFDHSRLGLGNKLFPDKITQSSLVKFIYK